MSNKTKEAGVVNADGLVQEVRSGLVQLISACEAQDVHLRTGDVRRFLSSLNPLIKSMTLEARLDAALVLYNSQPWQCEICATHILAQSLGELTPAYFPSLQACISTFSHWGVVDDFGTRVLGPLLMDYPQEILPLLAQWNRSENPWERRLSMVAFTRKVGESGRFTQECLAFADNLLHDEADLVQKALGWALKDCMRGDKEVVLDYVRGLRRRGVSAVITLYAIRDLKGKEREDFLALKRER
jgi:3-methyladenine DNA glycosylase AlkD